MSLPGVGLDLNSENKKIFFGDLEIKFLGGGWLSALREGEQGRIGLPGGGLDLNTKNKKIFFWDLEIKFFRRGAFCLLSSRGKDG